MTVVSRSAKTSKADATRRSLIAAARQLFGDKGYLATSVDEVVRHAGLPQETIDAILSGNACRVFNLSQSRGTG